MASPRLRGGSAETSRPPLAARDACRVEIGAPRGHHDIYVTHDQTEAMGLADRIAVLHAGRIQQQPITGADMDHSPYLDRPLLPLAVALPPMLEKVGVDLTTAGPAEARRLRQRAQFILDLLTPRQSPPSA